MSSKDQYYDPDKVSNLVKEELEFRKSQNINKRVVTSFLNKELLYDAGDIINKQKEDKRQRYSAPVIDPMTAFKLKEDSQSLLEFDNKKAKQDASIETNTLISKLPKYEILKLQLYPMSSEEIREKAVVNVSSINREPGLTHGLFDKRMGSTSRREICITCARDDQGCGGHFGYIDLPEKIVNPMFKKQTIWTLQCICPYCGDTYIDEKTFRALELHKIPKKKLLKVVAELSEKWLWELHDHGLAKVIYEKEFRGRRLCYMYDTDAKKHDKTVRSVQNMIKMFNSVPDEKYKLIGFIGVTRPINFITDVIPCAPPHIRSTSVVNGRAMENPLTERYSSILTSIIRLQQHVGSKVEREGQLDVLYSQIESIAYGPEKKMGVKVPLKEAGILSGLGTKEGSVRKNMMGKRVNHCGRTVAGPGFECNVGEVMIPQSGADVLFIPIIVHQYNHQKVIKRFREGIYKMIFMKVVTSNGACIITKRLIKEYTPEIGDILLRHLETGDRILNGRQPSLHAESLMAFNIILNPWETVKIPNYINHAFNADFDGDELTYHVLQNVRAMAEADTVMNSKYHIMNVQSNRPMMAMAFHALMGPFFMTNIWMINGKRSEVIIPEKRWHEALSLINDSYRKESLDERLKRHKINPRSGRALISSVFPTNFTYTGNGLTIIDGILVKGTMKKSNIGLKVLSIVQILAKMYSIKEACRFINDTQKISDWFMMWHSLSIGYKDFDANRKEVVKMLKKDVNKMQFEYFNLGDKPKDEISLFFWMRALYGIVDKTRDNGKKIGEKYLANNNGLNILSEDKGCGAKGSLANTSQITGSLGEQFIGASIPSYKLKGKTRCLPFFVSDDVSLESIGYVIRSYMDGINPSDSIFHEMASRITLIDTARNVSEIGYTHRRVEKSLEPIIISWLGLVTSADGRLFQPLFGAGLDVSKSQPVKATRTGERIFFCNFEAEAKLLCRIHEKKVLGDPLKKPKIPKPLDEFHIFKQKTGRFPKFSELE